MKLKNDITAAMAVVVPGLTEDRKQDIIATIKATRPEKLGELHAVFTQKGAGLTEPERAFYNSIVELDGEEPSFPEFKPEPVIPLTPQAATPVDGKPAARSFTPGKKTTTNGNGSE